MLDLHRLRLLRELKHRGTLAAVAEALSYSPSAISQQLRLLEGEAGVILLEPVGRGVRLTAQAEILVGHTEAVLGRLEQAEAELAASVTEISGTLRVASFQTAALALLPPVLTVLTGLHPGLRVEVVEEDPDVALRALTARDFDLVIGEEYPGLPLRQPPELEQQDLAEDPMRVVLRAGADRGYCTLSDLASEPWVMERAGAPARSWAVAACRAAGFEPDVRYEAGDLLLHVRLAETGHAVALVPDLVWAGAPPATTRVLPGAPSRRIFTSVRRGAGRHPAVLALREELRRQAQDRRGGR